MMEIPGDRTVEDASTAIGDFEELYRLRETLRLQYAGATDLTAPVYNTAIQVANDRLAELAPLQEVQQHLEVLGGTALRGSIQLEALAATGLVPEEDLAAKKVELEAAKARPGVLMALEFLKVERLPDAGPVRVRLATEGQVAFGQKLGLEITAETPRGIANKMLDAEVKKRSRAEIKSGNWPLFKVVYHPTHGECEISKIHQEIAKVTLTPLKKGRKIVVSAMNLPSYPKPSEEQ